MTFAVLLAPKSAMPVKRFTAEPSAVPHRIGETQNSTEAFATKSHLPSPAGWLLTANTRRRSANAPAADRPQRGADVAAMLGYYVAFVRLHATVRRIFS